MNIQETTQLLVACVKSHVRNNSHLEVVCEPVALGVCILHGEENILVRHHTSLRHSLDPQWQVTIVFLKAKKTLDTNHDIF